MEKSERKLIKCRANGCAGEKVPVSYAGDESWESRFYKTTGMILGLRQILANNTASLFTVFSILVSVCSLQTTFLPH